MAKEFPRVKLNLPGLDMVNREEKLGREEVLSLMKREIQCEMEKHVHEVIDHALWNKIIITIQGAFRGFTYRGFTNDYKVIFLNKEEDLIIECSSPYFEHGFFYLHIRDGKLRMIFNIFGYPSDEWE